MGKSLSKGILQQKSESESDSELLPASGLSSVFESELGLAQLASTKSAVPSHEQSQDMSIAPASVSAPSPFSTHCIARLRSATNG